MRFSFLAIVFLFFGCIFSVAAQDLIVLKSGIFVEGRVIEVTRTEIRYKPLYGYRTYEVPTVVILATNVLSIWYESGAYSGVAHDIIALKNRTFIEGKVIEITPTEIRYRRINNLDGPTGVVPAANVLSIRYENGTTELINAEPAEGENRTLFAVMDPNTLYFSLSADPSGFFMYGPALSTEFTKNHFNSQISISFPSIGLMVNSDGFGIGFGVSLNYIWYTGIGPIYLGALFDYSGYNVKIPGLIRMPNGKYTDGNYDYSNDNFWENTVIFAANLGYKFIFSSGFYINLGANLGVSITNYWQNGVQSRNSFLFKPNTSVGYKF
jgi:PKD repeat protein